VGKLFGVVLAIIAIVSRILSSRTGTFSLWTSRRTVTRSTSSSPIRCRAGLSFLAAQLLLAFFVWRFSQRKPGSKVWNIPAAPH